MCFLNSIAARFTLFKAQIVVCLLHTQRLFNDLELKKYSATDQVKVTLLARSPRKGVMTTSRVSKQRKNLPVHTHKDKKSRRERQSRGTFKRKGI